MKLDDRRLEKQYDYGQYKDYLYALIGLHAFIDRDKLTQDDENHAKQAIIEFYNSLKRMEPEQEYILKEYTHNQYLIYLLNLDKALRQGNYCNACKELYDCVEYGILQGRYYYNVLEILRDRMELENDEK